MTPLLMLAASLLPEIAKTFAAEKDRDAAAAVAAAVGRAVVEAVGTEDPAAVQQRIAADPAAAAELRLKLAQIAADGEERRRRAGLDELKARLDAQAGERAAELEALKAGIADRAQARSALGDLAREGSWVALGAPAVSLVVTVGFFLLVVLIVLHPNMQSLKDGPLLQLLHVMFGTFATGFATVISYWLGSSVGSRSKDAAAFALQREQAAVRAPLPSGPAPSAPVAPVRAAGRSPGAPGAAFPKCLALVLQQEGGFVDNPRDPGGATNLGITRATLEQWRGETVGVEEVRSLTREEAGEIYRARYWNALHCDALPAGIDLVAFDMGVNLGPARAARLLQKAVGAAADGAIGPATLAATRAVPASDVIRALTASRLAWYQGLSTWSSFGRGWTRRSSEIERAALAMAA